MIQQVNLYQDSLKPQASRSDLTRIVYAVVFCLLLLTAFSVYLNNGYQHDLDRLKSMQQQLSQLQTTEQQLQIKYPPRQLDKLLLQELKQYQLELSALSQLVNQMTDPHADQTQGFSRYFSALARQSIAEVWLRTIVINAQQHSLKLSGSTFKPDKIAIFLQKLHQEPVFQGRHFSTLILAPAEKSKTQIDFTLATSTDSVEQNDEH